LNNIFGIVGVSGLLFLCLMVLVIWLWYLGISRIVFDILSFEIGYWLGQLYAFWVSFYSGILDFWSCSKFWVFMD